MSGKVSTNLHTFNPMSKCGEILRAESGKYVFLCFHCAAEFLTAEKIMQHIEEAHFSMPIHLLPCDKDTKSDLKLKKKTKNGHPRGRPASVQTSTKDTEANLSIHGKSENLKFVFSSDLSESTSHEIIKNDILNQVTNSHNGMHECTKCGIHISGKAHFRLHMESHANKKPHKCDDCGRGFNLKSALRLHQKMHKLQSSSSSSDPNPKKVLPVSTLLNITSNKRKPTKKSLTCDVCGLISVDHKSFVQHSETHSTGEPCICKICDESFNTIAELNEHRRNHKGKKAVQCKLCSKSFFSDSLLESHLKCHDVDKPNKCDVCGRTYVKRHALEEHLRTHTGEKPYNCFVCGKSFARRVLVRQHERIHTGETPFKCRYCDLMFTYGASRRAHEKNKHPEM